MSVLQAEAPPSLPIGTTSPSAEPSENPPDAMPPIEQRMGPGKFPGLWKPVRSAFWAIHVAFGSACLILILAILAGDTGTQYSDAGLSNRSTAASCQQWSIFADGFPLMTLAPRLGVIVFFSILLLIPVRLQATRTSDAAVILGESHVRVIQMASQSAHSAVHRCDSSDACDCSRGHGGMFPATHQECDMDLSKSLQLERSRRDVCRAGAGA